MKFNSPLRYPGGKQKLTPFIEKILEINQIDGHYIEPFAGGAGVALKLLISKKIKTIHLNDYDVRVYAFWKSIINENEKFCRHILETPLNIKEWKKQKNVLRNYKDYTFFEIGFSAFYLNRCNRSGILNAGVIGGVNQNGRYKIDARFSKKALVQRVELIGKNSDLISISNLDAKDYIKTNFEKALNQTV